MSTRKSIHNVLFVICMILFNNIHAQEIKIYKIDELLNRINSHSDTTYVVNFWATWCKPCVAELPEFEKLHIDYQLKKVKVILVCMDFKEDIDQKLKPFLNKNKYTSEVVLLDESNGNDFINKISEKWSGAIPATLVIKNDPLTKQFFENKVTYDFLVEHIK